MPAAPLVWASLTFIPIAAYDRIWGWEHDSFISQNASMSVAAVFTLLWAGATWTQIFSVLRSGIFVGVVSILGVVAFVAVCLRMFEWRPCSSQERSMRIRQCAYFHVGSEEHIGFDRAVGPPLGSWCPSFVRRLDSHVEGNVASRESAMARVPCANVGMESMTHCGRVTTWNHEHVVGTRARCEHVVIFTSTSGPPASEWREWDACRRTWTPECMRRYPWPRRGRRIWTSARHDPP